MTTIFDFTLPKGYVDRQGEVHRSGKMRLATAGDEIMAARDSRVLANPQYLTAVVLSRVITELEGVPVIDPEVITQMFAADYAFLEDLYSRVNAGDLQTV